MVQVKRRSAAFTLIELLVVVIIVSVLASVGVPLLSGNVLRAKASEAEAGLGTVRTAARAYFAENGKYDNALLTNIGIKYTTGSSSLSDDLDGRFFSDDTYRIKTATGNTFCADVDGNRGNQALKKADVTTIQRAIDQDGTITQNGLCP